MADTAIRVVTETLLQKVVSLAADEISLAWNMEKQLGKLAIEVQKIQALLSAAQSSRITRQFLQHWLKDLKSRVLDAEIVLDDYGYEVLRQKIECRKRDKVRNFFSSSNPVFSRPKIAHQIKDVLSSFEELYTQSIQIGLQAIQLVQSDPDSKEMRLTVPFVEDSKVVGRNDDMSKLINMLTVSEYKDDLPVITIVGMGGQGKTTLAQLIYKNEKINNHFDKVIWVCVSDDFTAERLLGDMLRCLPETNHQLTGSQALVNELEGKLRGKRYLIVFDDVWNCDREVWDRMRACLLAIHGLKDSKILATTRSMDVASTMRTSVCHELQKLSDDESLSLFEKCAFAEGGAVKIPQLVEVGTRILKKCGGVPLAIKAIGGLLYSKNSVEEWLVIEKSNCLSALGGNDMVLSTIKLSYDNLPSLAVKQCFASCAIFEKDTQIKKNKLIQLWMAQGLLNLPKGSQLQMEDMGENYFNILLRNSLLQDAKMDDLNNITECKMHDLVHDVSLEVSESYCCHVKDWKVGTNKIEAMHVSISSGEREKWKSLRDVLPSKLRTLHLECCGDIPEDFFQNFKCLSALIVHNKDAKELPDSIGMMKHLRFLDIGGCPSIKRLPESFTKLYYLQTLIVWGLKELPIGFRNLINLRHIHMETDMWYWSEVVFKGLSHLRNLQTLPVFSVVKQKGCSIEEIEHLDNLKGELRIRGLENVESYESAMKSNLSKKSNIQILTLYWEERDEDRDDTDVVEGLKPHPNLKSLGISGYQSSKFPSWMLRENRLLCNLVSLSLYGLSKCESLPSLGHLPFLNDLVLWSLPKVKRIEKEFTTLFPALRRLTLYIMDSLVEWSDAIEMSSAVQRTIFPDLEEISLWSLPNLSVFPNLGNLPSLKKLCVFDCKNLRIREEWANDDEIQSQFQSLRQLDLQYCDNFTAPFFSMSLVQLDSLRMYCHPNSWPKDLHHLINLKKLTLHACGKIEENEFDCYPVWPYPKSDFVPLRTLILSGDQLPRVRCLPDQIQYMTALIHLEILEFDGLEAIPEWLGNLQSLQHLEIGYCKKLKQLPSAEAIQRLTHLHSLKIRNCPALQERYKRGSGSEWIKIAHIPHLDLDWDSTRTRTRTWTWTLVAELVTENGFKVGYPIKDRTEGSRGWVMQNSGLPWIKSKGLQFCYHQLD